MQRVGRLWHASVEKMCERRPGFDQQWIVMKSTVGALVAAPFVLMAAIPILIGVVIFAPVIIPMALLCGWLVSEHEVIR